MRVSDVFRSEFLRAADLGGINGRDYTLRIASVKKWDNDNNGRPKLVVKFANAKKPLLCNRTNAKTIAKAYGEEIDNWIGQAVVLFVTSVDFKGDQVEAIRLRIPQPTASQILAARDQQRAAQRAAEPPADDPPGHDYIPDAAAGANDLNDEVPF
jgi:hypothetical protein